MDHSVWVCLNQDLDEEEDVSLKRFYMAMNFMIAASIFYIFYACFYILHMFVDRGIGSVKENLDGGKNDKVERQMGDWGIIYLGGNIVETKRGEKYNKKNALYNVLAKNKVLHLLLV